MLILCERGSTRRVLFTDLHAGNVLSGQRRPWLLIDPNPYVCSNQMRPTSL